MPTRISKHMPNIISVFSDLIEKYDLKVEETGNLGMKMYNPYCIILAGIDRYDETVTMGIQNPKNEDIYYFYDIKKIKGDFIVRPKLSEEKHIASLEYTAKYIDTFLSKEMMGDFSEIQPVYKRIMKP